MNILRVSTFPTDIKPGMGLHPYYISHAESQNVFFLTPKDKGVRSDSKNIEVIESPFLLESKPKHLGRLVNTLFLFKRLWYIARFSFVGVSLIFTRKIDLVHIHSPMYFLIAFVGRLLGKKVFITFHGSDFHRIKESRLYRWFSWVFDAVFAISPDMIGPLSKIHGLEKVFQVFNGIERSKFQNFGHNRKKQILAVGSLKQEKGFDMLIQAFKRFLESSDELSEYSLIICGEGSLRVGLSKLIDDYDLVDKVSLVGHLNHKALLELYNQSEIFALSSRSEGFPKVLLEAISCGCKVVSTTVGSVPEVLHGYEYLSNFDDELFARKLADISQVSSIEMVAYYESVLNRYSWDSVSKVYNEVFVRNYV